MTRIGKRKKNKQQSISQTTIDYCRELLVTLICFVGFWLFLLAFMYDEDHLLFCLLLCFLPMILLCLLTVWALFYIYIFTIGRAVCFWCFRLLKKQMSRRDRDRDRDRN